VVLQLVHSKRERVLEELARFEADSERDFGRLS
jgi:hypothetical protein